VNRTILSFGFEIQDVRRNR